MLGKRGDNGMIACLMKMLTFCGTVKLAFPILGSERRFNRRCMYGILFV